MARRKHTLTRKCAHEGCKEISRYQYDTKRAYSEASECLKGTDWLCRIHSRTELTQDTRTANFEEEYKIVPTWGANGYERTWSTPTGGKRASIWGDKWVTQLGDLPLGARVKVTTSIVLVIPSNPESMPEWLPLLKHEYGRVRRASDHKAVLLSGYEQHLTDGDFIVMVKNGELLVGKQVYGKPNALKNTLDKQAYRKLFIKERMAILGEFPHFSIGQRVNVKRWECDGYHCYKHKMVDYQATILSQDMFKLEVLTTTGKTVKVYLGYVSPETQEIES